jgi:hypothetical protein
LFKFLSFFLIVTSLFSDTGIETTLSGDEFERNNNFLAETSISNSKRILFFYNLKNINEEKIQEDFNNNFFYENVILHLTDKINGKGNFDKERTENIMKDFMDYIEDIVLIHRYRRNDQDYIVYKVSVQRLKEKIQYYELY